MTSDVLDEPDEVSALTSLVRRVGFHSEVAIIDDSVVLWLHGELDMATAPNLARTLSTALDGGPAALTLDLGHLGFVDSTGIRVLITAGRRARNEGCSLILRAPNRSVRKVLELTGLDQLMVIEPGLHLA